MKNCVMQRAYKQEYAVKKKSQNVVQKVMIGYVFSVLTYIRN